MRGHDLSETILSTVAEQDQTDIAFLFVDKRQSATSNLLTLGLVMAAVGPLYKSIEEFFDRFKSKSSDGEDDEESAVAKAGNWVKDLLSSVTKKEEPTAKAVPAPSVTPQQAVENKAQPLVQTLQRAAAKNNVAFTTLFAIAGIESNFKADAKAGTSSAVGMFQFTEGTWNYLVNSVYPNLRYTLDDRNDPDKAATVASLYINTICTQLSRQLKRDPTLPEIYLGYFLGPTGASKFLSALQDNPSQIAAELFPAQAKANRNVFYTSDRPLSLKQVMDKLGGRLSVYEEQAKSKSNATTMARPQAQSSSPPDDRAVPPKPQLDQLTPAPNIDFHVPTYASPGPSMLPGSSIDSTNSGDSYVRDKEGRLFAL